MKNITIPTGGLIGAFGSTGGTIAGGVADLKGFSILGSRRASFGAEGFEIGRVHGNSLSFRGPTVVYAIRNPDGSLYKIGESTQGLNRNGQSIRAAQQARAFQRITGQTFKTEVRANFDNKADARTFETRSLDTYSKLFGQLPPGNKVNR